MQTHTFPTRIQHPNILDFNVLLLKCNLRTFNSLNQLRYLMCRVPQQILISKKSQIHPQNEYHMYCPCVSADVLVCIYSGPCDLRPPIQPAKYGLNLKMVLK